MYGVDDESDGSLVRNTQSILHSMAELSQDLTAFLNKYFNGLISRASKMAIRLMLAHHHVSAQLLCHRHWLRSQVRGPHHETPGYVCSSNAYRTNREKNVSDDFTFPASRLPSTVLRRLCPDDPSNSPNPCR